MTTDFALTPNGRMHLRLKALREAVSHRRRSAAHSYRSAVGVGGV